MALFVWHVLHAAKSSKQDVIICAVSDFSPLKQITHGKMSQIKQAGLWMGEMSQLFEMTKQYQSEFKKCGHSSNIKTWPIHHVCLTTV